MKKLILGASCLMLASTHVQAQEIATETTTISPLATSALVPVAAPATTNAMLRAGTPIAFKLMEEITTKGKMAKVGQRFNLEVAAPVEVNGVTVIPAGTPAWGEIVGVRNKGMWGKSGKLDAKLLFLRVNGRQIRLTGSFDDKGVTGTGAVVGAILFIPIAGFFTTGTSAVLPMGGAVNGFIDEDVELAIANKAPVPLSVEAPAVPMSVNAESAEPVE